MNILFCLCVHISALINLIDNQYTVKYHHFRHADVKQTVPYLQSLSSWFSVTSLWRVPAELPCGLCRWSSDLNHYILQALGLGAFHRCHFHIHTPHLHLPWHWSVNFIHLVTKSSTAFSFRTVTYFEDFVSPVSRENFWKKHGQSVVPIRGGNWNLTEVQRLHLLQVRATISLMKDQTQSSRFLFHWKAVALRCKQLVHIESRYQLSPTFQALILDFTPWPKYDRFHPADCSQEFCHKWLDFIQLW